MLWPNPLQKREKVSQCGSWLVKTQHDTVSEDACGVGAESAKITGIDCGSVCVLHRVLVVADRHTIRGNAKLPSRHTAWDIFSTAQQPNNRACGHGGHGIF